jgi:hypothetical protein
VEEDEPKRERMSALALLLPPVADEAAGIESLLEPKMSARRSCVDGPEVEPFVAGPPGDGASSPIRSTSEPTSVLVDPTGFLSLAE